MIITMFNILNKDFVEGERIKYMRSKKAFANIITELIVQLINIICAFIIPKLIISTYGSNVNGLVTSITHFLTYITLLESGFGPVIKSVLFKPIANKDKDTIVKILKSSERIFKKISYIFIIYIAILCIVLPYAIKSDFSSLFSISLIIIMAISTFAEYYFGMTYRLYLQAEQKKYIVSIIQIGTLILNTSVILVLIYFNVSIIIVKLVSSLIFVLRPILQNKYVKNKYDIELKDVDSSYQLKQKWDGLVQHVAYVVHSNTDIVILTICTSLKEVSVYSIYAMIIEGVKKIMQAFTGGIEATFGDMIAKKENENLNNKFTIYEGIYLTISTILFSSTLFLIVPFVGIYIKGITDAEYIRPLFAYILVLAEFIYIIRQLYYCLVKVAGHFKQTKIGAYIEFMLNIIISIALVWRYGIIGVAIGTLVAMSVRTVEIVYYTSKKILNRNIWYSFKRMIIIACEVIIVSLVIRMIPFNKPNEYVEWILQTFIITIISSIIVIGINTMIYKENAKKIYEKVKIIVKIKKGI